jgi:hypothetical protein
MRISERLAPMALSAYRSKDGIEQPLRAFGNGGTITDTVWKKPWELTRGDNVFEVLDDILVRALDGDACQAPGDSVEDLRGAADAALPRLRPRRR